MKKIASLVTNDLHQDQRMNRICTSLANAGFEVTLIGRKRKKSGPLGPMPFQRLRLPCWFERSILFYAEYNIRLFFHLLRTPYDIINANDLDTILPAIWVGRIKNIPVVYDAHEYFTEQEEIVTRPKLQRFWNWIERYTIPKVAAAYTVSQGYANLFEAEYPVKFGVVRNATVLQELPANITKPEKYILYQGAVNYGRGLEQVLNAMPNVDGQLYICGDGDILPQLKKQAKALGIEHKVKFWGFIEPTELKKFTQQAYIGLTLFAKDGLSHYHSLANRFFDYMHAHVPQLAMAYPEYEQFNAQHKVALLIENIDPENITSALNELLHNETLYNELSQNAAIAKEDASWQAQEKVLIATYKNI
jgi:glycosyltransferase involved in cell wall biosynthesis